MNSERSRPSSPGELLAAHSRAATLIGLPWKDRLARVRGDGAFAVPSFIELAIGLSADATAPPTEREEWAQLAVEASSHRRSSRVEELEALAWAHLGSARRVRDHLWASQSAFARCAALRHRVRDPLELAETCILEASLRYTILDYERALGLTDAALRLSASSAGNDLQARCRIVAGVINDRLNRSSIAVEMNLAALERIDAEAHPRLALNAGHNLAASMIGIGHFDTAVSGILRLEANYTRFAEPKFLLQRDELLADVARARSQWREAETRYRGVRQGYAELGLHSHAAHVDHQLAKLAAKRQRWSEASHLAQKAAAGYAEAGSTRQAASAFQLFQRMSLKCRGAAALTDQGTRRTRSDRCAK